ncbi:MAG TPA: DUF4974 domain-containing protein [Cyclobacteriaceae bacterium]|nr:DUF4974 domain-containing protein [Cyclobacteriaceae bacterium]
MARSSFWKEKVALSALAIFFALSIQPAFSQSTTKEISFTCREAKLESVFEYLSRTSGFNFIYSTNLIDVSTPITFSVQDKPIGEILKVIEKQVSVLFKIKEGYIVVKALPKEAPKETQTTITRTPKKTLRTLPSSEAPLLTSVARTFTAQPSINNTTLLQTKLDRRINELQETLGPNVPRNIPTMYVNRLNFNNKHKGWFVAAGTFTSDNGSGLELQGGLRYLYAVVQPHWTHDRGLHAFYGIGNSFTLMRNFSFSTIYMYSGNSESATVYPYRSPVNQFGPAFLLTQTNRHHQVKLALQYNITRNFTVRGGPVLNYKTYLAELVPVSTPIYEGTYGYRQPGSQQTDIIYQNGQFQSSSFRTAESFLGWEAAISYRINFFRRK